jgi:nucleoid DNA-binding protein/nucleoid-associated protein YgaU
MKNKINTKALADALAQRLGIKQVDADKFLSGLQNVAEGAIVKDKILKVNGLGTFKLVWMQPRKSVNVQTGEAIEIAGHYKLNFLPEAELKNKVNVLAPHSAEKVQTTDEEVVKPLKKLGEQAEELKDILQSINNSSLEDQEPDYAQPDLAPSDAPVEIPVAQPETPPVKLEDLEQEAKSEVTLGVKASDYVAPLKKNCKKERCVIIWLVVVIALLGLIFFAYYFWKEPILKGCQNVSQTVVSWFVSEKEPPMAIPIDTLVQEVVEAPAVVVETHEPTIFERPREYNDFITTESVPAGSRLAWISYKYYGNKVFWVYIYEANRHLIPNPNKVMVGCKVRIPKLPAELIDVNNPECIEYAKQLHEQYIK